MPCFLWTYSGRIGREEGEQKAKYGKSTREKFTLVLLSHNQVSLASKIVIDELLDLQN